MLKQRMTLRKRIAPTEGVCARVCVCVSLRNAGIISKDLPRNKRVVIVGEF